MGIEAILSPQGVIPRLRAHCKREAIAMLAERAADVVGMPATTIEEALMSREQLGSTGVGQGVAIPHGKIEGLGEIAGVFARLDPPLDFEALDDEPVDLIFLLLAPADATAAHLKALAKVSRLMRDAGVREALRGAETGEALFAIATSAERPDAA